MAVAPHSKTTRRPPRAKVPTEVKALATGPDRQALVASVSEVRLDNLGWDNPRSAQQWQRELWRMLEIIGELKSAANWVSSHVSRVVIRMHDVDEHGEIGAPTKNNKAKAIAATLLGKPAQRREVLRMAGFNLWLVGETYIGALAGDGPRGADRWFAVSANDLKRDGSGKVSIDLGNGKRQLVAGRDMLLRCWTPHPDKAADADSSARAVRIVLRELEKLTLFVLAQVDSRLASGGVLIVPSGMTNATGDVTATDLTKALVETAASSLRGEGTAGSVVPLVWEVPPDVVGKVQHVTWSSELSAKARELRQEAVARLSNDLDIPAEELTGGMGDTNHWSSYQIGPDAIKKHIEPLMARLCLALQQGWVEHALTKAGLNPDKFHIWYDTTPLIVRPQRFQEALELWKEGRISSEALLGAAGFYPGDAPEAEEDVRRYLRELVLRDPQLFNQASVRELLGITEEMIPNTAGQALDPTAAPDQQLLTDKGTPAPPPPKPETVPQRPVTGRAPVSRDRNPAAVSASAAVLNPTPLALLAVADAVSLRALELAGGRLLTHKTRGTLRDVPRHEIHTHVPVGTEVGDLDKLLSGWAELLPTLASTIGVPPENVQPLTDALHRYCCATLISGQPHNRERMITHLTVAKVLDDFA